MRVELIDALECLGSEGFLVIRKEQSSEILMLEEVLAQVLILGLGEYLQSLRYLVFPGLGELGPHLQLRVHQSFINLVLVQRHRIRINLSILKIGDAMLRTRLLQMIIQLGFKTAILEFRLIITPWTRFVSSAEGSHSVFQFERAFFAGIHR